MLTALRQRRIPEAARIDGQRLMSVTLIPLAAALAMATAVATTGGTVDRVADAGGALAFVLDYIRFCYLAVGAAHLAAALTERMSEGLNTRLWLNEGDDTVTVPVGSDPFWHAFPNHVDGAAIALGLTLVGLWLG